MSDYEIPDLPEGVTHKVRCEPHDTLIGWLKNGQWSRFIHCGLCPCPAGGEHEWGTLEQEGTGTTWPGCENCGAAYEEPSEAAEAFDRMFDDSEVPF